MKIKAIPLTKLFLKIKFYSLSLTLNPNRTRKLKLEIPSTNIERDTSLMSSIFVSN